MFYIGFGTSILDIDDILGGYLDSKRRGYYYNDSELDNLIASGLAADTPEARLGVYQKLLAHVKDVAPWIFLFNLEDLYGANNRLKDWHARADEIVTFSKASIA
jgi:ABC-type transport system substrate-binding protein